MDEAGRLEIAGHVGRLGHELIRFAELARARLNAMQDYSDVPTLALQDEGWPIYMANSEEPRAGSLRLPRPNRGKRSARLPKPPDVEEIPEPPSSPVEGMRLWKEPDLWPEAGSQGVPSVRSEERISEASPAAELGVPKSAPRRFLPTPSLSQTEELPEAPQSPDAELGVPKSAPRRFLPTPSLRNQTEELPEPPQSPDAELGVPKSAPRRFLPTPSLRNQTEELPEPQSPDAELGVPKSAPRRFLPTPSLRNQTKELQAAPEPGTPEPPWSPEEKSPQLRRRLFEEEAPEPPLAPEVEHDADALGCPAGPNWPNGRQDRRSRANGTPLAGAAKVTDSESVSSMEVAGGQNGQRPDTGRLQANRRLARGNKASHRKRRVGGAYQAHVMNQAAAALGRLQEEVSALRQRMVAMEAPSGASAAPAPGSERSQRHVSEISRGSDDSHALHADSHALHALPALPEPPEAPQDEVVEVGQKHVPVPQAVPVPDQGAAKTTFSAARSRSPSVDSLDYWAELNQVDPGSAVQTARNEVQKQGANLNASRASTGSVPAVPAEMRAEPPKAAAKEVPTAAPTAEQVKVPPKQALSYWLQVDSIFGLEATSNNGEVTYEVQSYWLSLMASVVRLTSAPKHNRSECRVRNQVVLPKATGTRLAVEVVQKTPDVLYIGRVDLDASETSVHQVDSYELLPSNARIRLRICPHRASVASVSAAAAGGMVTQPQTPTPATPRGSLQSVASCKALPVEDRTAGQSTAATSAVTPATVRPAGTTSAAVAPPTNVAPAAAVVQAETEEEYEEGEEEELTEDDPMVAS